MRKIKNKRTKLIYGSLILLLVVLLVGSAFLLLQRWEKGQGLFVGNNEDELNPVVTVDGVDYIPNEDVQGILVMGLDKFESSVDNTGFTNDQQADFVMLFVLDNENKTYSAIHLNRDTMCEMNVLGVAGEKIDVITQQLALAHTYGNGREVSCRNTADAVSGLLNNIKIERYVSFTMDVVPVITDLVGGVEVKIQDDFSGIDDTLVMGETVLLKGNHALNFVRTRQGLEDSSNATRMIRQQEYLTSLFKTLNQKVNEDENFLINTSLELSDYMVSNYTATQLENIISNISDYQFNDIYELEGESKVGEQFMEFYADKEYINNLVLDLFYKPKK